MTSFLVTSLASSCLDLPLLAATGRGLRLPLEGGGAVLEELLLPEVELGRLDVVPVAQVGDRHAVDQVLL